jgi:selenocysteine-specific elongation factor
MATDLILGTAGHIDHGKSALVRALTGIDTDRLPEEKRRGITIELGFAELNLGEFRLGIVDVPGHERFVRNMLAGATGMDLALLVVAADDSVKPQTREHLEILRLLNLEAGVIAVTKCDLVEPDWIELVQEEIRELVADTFLERAPMVSTSTLTGEGISALRDELASAAAQVSQSARLKRIEGPFRMAIDRAFTIAGHGTVVTGSVSSGRTQLGDELVVEPGAIKVRVRGLQNHERTVEQVQRGQRAAINLAGIHHEKIVRGQELASAGHLHPSRLLTGRLSLLDSVTRPLADRKRVRVHIGTTELLATVRLLGQDRLEPGASCAVQLFLNAPAVAVWSQPFVVRSESPVMTIGGGAVLDPSAERIRRANAETLEWIGKLSSPIESERASAALYFAGLRGWKPDELPRTTGIDTIQEVEQKLRESGELLEIELSPTRRFRVHRRVFDQLCDRIETAGRKLHERFPLRTILDRSLLTNSFRYLPEDAVLTAALQQMHRQGRLQLSGKGVTLTGHGPKLSQNERKLMTQLVENFRRAGLQSPSVKECQKQATKNQDSVPQLLNLAAENGDLVAIAPNYYVHAEVLRDVQQSLEPGLATDDGLTVSQIREILNTTRKYAVPLCEYFDRVGFTERRGDARVLAHDGGTAPPVD